MKNIHEEVNTSIGRWILEKEGVYIPFCGVVNNQSEGFNTVLKNLQEWKEVPVDCIVLSLHLLQSFYMNEFKRGLTGQGNYHLHERFISLIDLEELGQSTIRMYSPWLILSTVFVQKMKGYL